MITKEASILEHLTELRKRLIIVLLSFVGFFILSLYWSPELYRFVTSPLKQKLLVLGPNDILWIYVRLASLMSFSLVLPVITYQIWAYVRPGLTSREARGILTYIPAVFVCFVAGLAFGFYLVMPALFQVLLSLGDGLFITQITAQNYLSFVWHTTLPLAVLFEFPVVIAFLTHLGLVNSRLLKTYRRQAYFVMICLAVIMTPADVISDLVMSLPLLLIYEIGIIVSRRVEKKRG
ncbi:twin-arginine translocase subunit TatC [Streptococcus entericus]|uniref:twin-arginine translocase subunit TatC n=1 Tax=Streptococcus entericus TaxID=155680 RepID=UPI000360AD2C|nr:twin-arginine translocase subunit TatC [Streptococcus entericus]